MKKSDFGKRFLSFALVVAMSITNMSLSGITANAEDEVTVNVSNAPYMDIVLTQTDNSVNTSTFEADLKAKLKTLGIDTSNTDMIQVSTVETVETDLNSMSASDIISTWYNYPGSDIASYYAAGWSATSAGGLTTSENVNYTGYLNWTEDAKQTSDATFNFDLSIGDHQDPQGWTFCTTKNDDGTYSFYALEVNHKYGKLNLVCIKSWKPSNGYTTHGGPIYHGAINGQDGLYDGTLKVLSSSYQGATGYTIAQASVGNKSNYSIKIIKEGSNIKVYENGTLYINATDSTLKKGTYGPYTCSQYTSTFSNINVESKIKKEYSDVLSEPNLRDNAYHFIVNVDDTTTMFTNGNTRASVLSRTMNDDIHFIDWGTSSTQSYANAFIKDNANKGKFTLSNNYNQAVADTANYIYSVVQKDADSEYVVVDEPTNINVTPASLKTNTATTTYPNGKWYIDHDYKFYENNTGLSAQTQNYKSDLICSFDKPGKYDIYFADKLVKTIYAHRLPVASFNIGLNGSAITLTSTSYDLDEQSKGTNGIKTEKWSYMLTDASGNGSWYDGKPTTFDNSKVYLIKLEVEDFQGGTSYTTKYLGKGSPVAAFDVDAVTSKYATLKVTDASYDPKGYAITKREWVLKKNGTQVGTYTTPITNFNTSALGVGTYQYVLTVTNSKGTKSETYTKTFSIIEDTTKPEILVNPTKCDWKTGTQAIEVRVSDSDSGLKNWQYAFTNSQTTPTSGWSVAQTTGNTTLTTPSTTGEYYLHIKATDNAGNVLDRALGTYKIDNSIPVVGTLTIANDCTKVTANATDAGSGIFGYAITTENVAPTNESDYQASNELKVYKSGTYYVWARDKVGQVSASKSVVVNRKQTATINYVDNNDSEKLRPSKVTLSLYRNGTKLKDVEIDGTTTSYTFDNLDSMDSTGKAYTYTFGLDINERYDVKVNGDTITATMKTSSFSVTIPKTISVSGETGKVDYNVTTSGTLYLNDNVSVTPSSSFDMTDKTGYQTMKVTISQSKTSFKKATLGSTTGTLTTNQKEFAGSWSGNFNFVIKLTKSN